MVVILFNKHAGMPHRIRFYYCKNSERKRRQKSSTTGSSDVCDSSHESSIDQVTLELFSETSGTPSSDPIPSPAATEQADTNEESSIRDLRDLRSSVVLPASWSDQSSDDHETMHAFVEYLLKLAAAQYPL